MFPQNFLLRNVQMEKIPLDLRDFIALQKSINAIIKRQKANQEKRVRVPRTCKCVTRKSAIEKFMMSGNRQQNGATREQISEYLVKQGFKAQIGLTEFCKQGQNKILSAGEVVDGCHGRPAYIYYHVNTAKGNHYKNKGF
jgi:hypothetical protein